MSGLTHEKRVSTTDEWFTPPEVFEDIIRIRFDMDVCSPGQDAVPHIPADFHLTVKEDGLTSDWLASVWMNPPYKDTVRWVDRMLQHHQRNGSGIVLTFARTGTSWAQRLLSSADAVLFLNKRIRFMRPDGTRPGSPGADSMLCAFGRCEATALRSAATRGHGVLR